MMDDEFLFSLRAQGRSVRPWVISPSWQMLSGCDFLCRPIKVLSRAKAAEKGTAIFWAFQTGCGWRKPQHFEDQHGRLLCGCSHGTTLRPSSAGENHQHKYGWHQYRVDATKEDSDMHAATVLPVQQKLRCIFLSLSRPSLVRTMSN